jgi:hypothetical protein
VCWAVIVLGLLFSLLGPLNVVFPEVFPAEVAALFPSWAGLTRSVTGRVELARVVLGGCWNDTVKSKYNLAGFEVSGKFKVSYREIIYGLMSRDWVSLLCYSKIPIEINELHAA